LPAPHCRQSRSEARESSACSVSQVPGVNTVREGAPTAAPTRTKRFILSVSDHGVHWISSQQLESIEESASDRAPRGERLHSFSRDNRAYSEAATWVGAQHVAALSGDAGLEQRLIHKFE
jgi:hypothetical protein